MLGDRRRAAGQLTGYSDKVVVAEILCVDPTSLGEDRMVRRATNGHAIRKLETPDLSASTRSDTECSEGTILSEHEVAVANRRDRFAAAVGHLDERVARQAFVEAVARELLHQLPDAFGLRGRGVALAAAGEELLALLGHELAVLLAHGA